MEDPIKTILAGLGALCLIGFTLVGLVLFWGMATMEHGVSGQYPWERWYEEWTR